MGHGLKMDENKSQAETFRRRNLWVLATVAFINGLYLGMFMVVQQPFMLKLGASMSLIGLLMSIGGMSGILTTIVQPISGSLSDVLGRKPFLVVARLLILGGLFSYLFAALTQNWLFLLPATMLGGISAMSWPIWDATVAESVEAEKRGMAYSITLFFSTLPGIFTRPVGGYVADKFGYIPIFLISIFFEFLCLLILLLFFRETITSKRKKIRVFEVIRRSLTLPKSQVGFYLLIALDAFIWGMVISILPGMLTDAYGLSNLELGIMLTFFSSIWAFAQLPVGKLIDRFGSKPFLFISEGLGMLAMAIFLKSSDFTQLLIAQGIWGLSISTWIPSLMSYIAGISDETSMAGSLGKVSAIRGLLSFPAPTVGGILYDKFGLAGPILPTIFGTILVVSLMTKILK